MSGSVSTKVTEHENGAPRITRNSTSPHIIECHLPFEQTVLFSTNLHVVFNSRERNNSKLPDIWVSIRRFSSRGSLLRPLVNGILIQVSGSPHSASVGYVSVSAIVTGTSSNI